MTTTTDEPQTRDEIVKALTEYARHAARQPHVRDCATWVNAHKRMDELLYDLELLPADA